MVPIRDEDRDAVVYLAFPVEVFQTELIKDTRFYSMQGLNVSLGALNARFYSAAQISQGFILRQDAAPPPDVRLADP